MTTMRRTTRMIATGAVGVLLVAVLCAAGDRGKNIPPREVTLTGTVVDLHNHMTGKFASTDKAECTRKCIRAGVPVALETEDGLILISEGPNGAARMLAPLAFEMAEVTGTLYEKNGLRYVDLTSAKAAPMISHPDLEPDVDEP